MIRRLEIGPAEVFLSELLTADESAIATRQLLDPATPVREKCWHSDSGLITIGRPLYRSRDCMTEYVEQARTVNALLYSTYRWLYDRVADYFEDRYGLPVDFAAELAVPGFHLMMYDGAGRFEGGGWHVDQVAHQAPYFAGRIDELDGILNFTLPLAVPSGGTGMDIAEPEAEGGRAGGLVHVPYRPGVVLFNECEVFHRIGASVCRQAGELRLTMQGHGVRHRGRVLLFW
jgi:hypothetical protein